MSIKKEGFEKVNFGDRRLTKRYVKIVEKIRNNPEASFPMQMNRWADLKGLYRFFDNEKVSYEEILQSHIDNTVKRCFEEEVVLIVQDTTYLNYSNHPAVNGMGYIGSSEGLIGMLVHNVYGVSGEDRKPLGLIHQEVIVRKKKVAKEETGKERLLRERESEKWKKGLIATHKLLSEHKKVIQVCDREADIYLFIKEIMEKGEGFVIRCGSKQRSTQESYIFEEIKKAIIVGYANIEIERNGNRKKRVATIEIKFCKVKIKPPKIINRNGENLPVNIVIVEEKNPPNGKEKLFWILLTNENIRSNEDCLKVIKYYQSRWLIEDFHKGLKTGCKIEKRQLRSIEKLKKVLAVFSVVVYQLLLLRFLAKHPNEKEIVLNPIQITILKELFPKESCNLNSDNLILLIAKLGGFIGRKSDKSPGWVTIMRGMQKLLIMEQGFHLGAKKNMGKG